MSNFKKIEEQEFKTIKRYDSGMLELYMNNYIVRLQTKDNVFNITLIEDGKDLNIPNKFDKTDSIDALFFFECKKRSYLNTDSRNT
jgi:hypothetical protein